MNRLVILALLLVSYSSSLMAQNNDFKSMWKEAIKLANEGKPASSNELIDKIFNLAEKQNDYDQMIKALIYKSSQSRQLEEDHIVVDIQRYETRYQESTDPVLKSLYANIIAKRYKQYLQRNMYRISNRTQILNKDDGDILTYTVRDLIEKTNDYFLASIENKSALQNIKGEDLEEILIYNKEDLVEITDAYVIISMDVIRHFRSTHHFINEPQNKFPLTDEALFGSIDEFVALKFEASKNENNDESFTKKVITLYQDLLSEYKSNDNLVQEKINVLRLRFMKQHANFAAADAKYIESLEDYLSVQNDNQAKELVSDELLKAYMSSLRSITYSSDEKWSLEKQNTLAKALSTIKTQQDSKVKLYRDNANNSLSVIEQKLINVQLEKVVPINKEALCFVSYKNVNKLNSRIIKVSNQEIQKLQRSIYEEKFNKLEKYDSVVEWSDNLPQGTDYMNHSIEIVVPPLRSGSYLMVSHDASTISKSDVVIGTPIIVSDLAYDYESINGLHQLVVVNRNTGYPVSDVKVEAFEYKYDHRSRENNLELVYSGYTQANGVVEMNIPVEARRHNIHFVLEKGDDKFNDYESYNHLSSKQKSNPKRSYLWFTDRSIYRPGQTIHFKGIALDVDAEGMPTAATNKQVKIHFKDANGQAVEELDLKTDDYGSISGTFIIPSSGLNGNFSFGTNDPWSYKSIKVEDYKRPKFQPIFDISNEEYKLGDLIDLKAIAKSYAGINLVNAKYNYTIYRQSYYPWYKSFYWCGFRPLPTSNRVIVSQGNGLVDEKGNIDISFLAESDPLMIDEKIKPNYQFIIQLDVTDIDGETRSGSKTILLGTKKYVVDVDHPTHLPKSESGDISIAISNFDNQKIDKKGEIIISSIENYRTSFREKLWPYPEFHSLNKSQYQSVFSNDLYSIDEHPYQQKTNKVEETLAFDSSNSSKITLPKLKPGFYIVQIKIEGELQEQTSYIQIFDKVIEGSASLSILGGKNTYTLGDKAKLKSYSSYDDTKLFYRIYKKGALSSFDWTSNDKEEVVNIDKDSYGNMKYSVFYIKNNRQYKHDKTINVPWVHKKLDINLTTFRDQVLPGSEETHTLIVNGSEDAKNQLTLAMYDASLDAFVENKWSTFEYPIYYYHSRYSQNNFGVRNGWLMSKYINIGLNTSESIYFPRLLEVDGIGMQLTGRSAAYGGKEGRMVMKSKAVDAVSMAESTSAPMMDNANINEEADGNYSTENEDDNIDSNQEHESSSAPPIRKNLNETVFFYPNLETNENGELTYSFIMNEAITEWKLMSFAHNKEMQFGYHEQTLVTKKDLLIQANMPRFLRAGDKTIFTAKVSNLSDKLLAGEARIEIINAITEESVLSQLTSDVSRPFNIKVDGSNIVEWTLDIPEDFIMPVIIKVYATSGIHTDGEQNMLTVLTNRKLVTSTKSMMVRPNETKEFAFEHLLENIERDGLATQNFQIEFTTNPVWFAIKAMPYLSVKDNESTTSYADQIFGNTLASEIIESNPKIKLIFDQWKNDPEALKSELEKNEEFKEALLAETPWVRSAQSEAQQRKDIALLFDINKLSNEFQSTIQVLENRQTVNGGFSWNAGGRDSRYTTQHVIEQLLRLKRMTNLENAKVDRMIERGMAYLTERVKEEYKRYVKLGRKHGGLPYYVVHYSFLNAMYEGQLFGDIGVEAKAHYRAAFKKHWYDLSPYGQAMIGLAQLRSDKNELSAMILESLQETLIRNEELGAYWKNNNGYSWYNLNIEQQALAIEFFEEASIDSQIVNELKMWLLTKKQTTHWPTSKSTTAAIYALVNNNASVLNPSSKIELWLGDELQNINSQEAGTGYFEIKHNDTSVNVDYGNIKVMNPNDHIIWGAAYWQYWDDLDKIDNADDNPFTINKEVFLQETSNSGTKLKTITENDLLVQGDKLIVRVELKTDRDLDYVQMRDMRAAGLEPISTLSQYKYQDGLSYYETTRDKYTDFFFQRLNRGTYVFEYELRVTHRGEFSNGITTAQCLYAPSFSGLSEGIRLSFN